MTKEVRDVLSINPYKMEVKLEEKDKALNV
jgi:hypothetical protein